VQLNNQLVFTSVSASSTSIRGWSYRLLAIS